MVGWGSEGWGRIGWCERAKGLVGSRLSVGGGGRRRSIGPSRVGGDRRGSSGEGGRGRAGHLLPSHTLTQNNNNNKYNEKEHKNCKTSPSRLLTITTL